MILLHREDVYDKESPRTDEADLIIGKHRGGPTGTITVALQGHYSRFVDMNQPWITPVVGSQKPWQNLTAVGRRMAEMPLP